jgi:glycosyltransferase involved in cell wall biosynthesis
VLYICTAYPRSESDVITPWLVETVERLRQAGTDVRVFTSSYRGLGHQNLHGTPVYRFRYFFRRWEDLTHDETAIDRVKKGLRYKVLALCYMFFGTVAAWRLARRERFDVVHVHWPLPHWLFGWAAARACRASTVASFHGAELMAVRHGMRLLRPFLAWAIKTADAVTANSTHTVKAIQEIFHRPVSIVPYGSTAGECRDQTAIQPKPVRQLLFVGRLVERKGVPYLVKAVELLSRDLPVHLSIVGTGPDEGALRRQVAELRLDQLVTFHGFVTSVELAELYRNCDVFVLPAVFDAKGDTEGLGVVLIDAMSHRRPVVASGVGGIVDLVIDGQTGLSVPPADVSALAGALRRLLTDPDLAFRLAQAGHDHVQRNYSWGAIISRLQQIYIRLHANASPSHA